MATSRARPTDPHRRVEAWPRSVGLAALTAAVASLPLILLQPVLCLVLAIVALVLSLAGARVHSGPERREYQVAAALALASLTLLVVASLTLLAAGAG
jgi:hypothetical protein